MFAYLFIDLFIVLSGLLVFFNNYSFYDRTSERRVSIYIFLVFILLFIFSAFRGNMTADYDNYVDLYDRFSSYSLKGIVSRGWFDYPEEGYIFFQFLIKKIFNNVLFIFIITSFFILIGNFKEIKAQWKYAGFLPILLFVEIGEYYNSFNLIRQVIAATIIILGSKYLYEEKFFKYLLIVIVATLFHKSSIIMLPCYFLLNIRFTKKTLIVYFIVLIIGLLFLKGIISFVQKYYWSWYTDDGYGMTGYSFKNVVFPCIISIVPIISYFFNQNNISKKEEIWLNASCLYFVFCVIGLRLFMVTRFMVFFSLYSILAFSSAIRKIKDPILRFLSYVGIVLLTIMYGYFSKNGTGLNPYYFT